MNSVLIRAQASSTRSNTLTTSDFVFFGHDYKAESIITDNGDGAIFNIIMGEEFNINLDEEGKSRKRI